MLVALVAPTLLLVHVLKQSNMFRSIRFYCARLIDDLQVRVRVDSKDYSSPEAYVAGTHYNRP